MKRFYSVILLLSFLVGVMQPILPMIEYQLYGDGVWKLLIHNEDTADQSFISVSSVSEGQSPQQKKDINEPLLNDNYYPIGVQNAVVMSIYNRTHVGWWQPHISQDIKNPSFLPIIPPPKYV